MKVCQVDDPHSVFSFGNNIDKLVVEIYLLRRVFVKCINRGCDGLIVAED